MFNGLKLNHEKTVMEVQKNILCIFKEMKNILKVNTIWLVDVVSTLCKNIMKYTVQCDSRYWGLLVP